jgi:DNA-binding protein YbaB
VFESIKSIRPHFHSLREIQNNVSLDIKLPLNWHFENIVKQYKSIQTKVQDKNDKFTLLSIVSQATQDGYDVVFACAIEIIKLNYEEEEKQRLFREKVKQLEELFKSESLDNLKEINLFDKNGQKDSTGIGLVEQGDEQGQDGDRESQESDD